MTEEDLPTVETPNTLNVSPLGSFAADSHSDNDSTKPEELQPPAASSPTMPITKVQPFMTGEAMWCSWCHRYGEHMEIIWVKVKNCSITHSHRKTKPTRHWSYKQVLCLYLKPPIEYSVFPTELVASVSGREGGHGGWGVDRKRKQVTVLLMNQSSYFNCKILIMSSNVQRLSASLQNIYSWLYRTRDNDGRCGVYVSSVYGPDKLMFSCYHNPNLCLVC